MERLESPQWGAAFLGITTQRFYSLAREGLIPVVKIGRQYRVDPEALREWVRNGGQGYEGGRRKVDLAAVN